MRARNCTTMLDSLFRLFPFPSFSSNRFSTIVELNVAPSFFLFLLAFELQERTIVQGFSTCAVPCPRIRSWVDERLISSIDRTDFITSTICISGPRYNTLSRVSESSSISARIVPDTCKRTEPFFPSSFFRGCLAVRRIKKRDG